MICKKCGNDIPENSKFCGICGEKVEILNQTEELNNINETEETIVIPTVNFDNEPKKKSYAWIFIVLAILIGVIAVSLVVLGLSKFSNSSVRELDSALNIMSEKGENSGTIDMKLLIETNTSDIYNLTATAKYDRKYDDKYDMSLTLNKSMLYEEMNLYTTINDYAMTLYAKSSLIDMLGFTSSTADMWVNYKITQSKNAVDVDDIEDIDIDLYSVLDKKHYKLIDKDSGLKHYQLVIDNELLKNIKSMASRDEDYKEFEQSLGININEVELTEAYYLDIYINNLGELVKVSMDLTDKIKDETINKVVISFEFSNLGNTSVQIPIDAKNSTLDLETYMNNFSLMQDTTEKTQTNNNAYNYNNYYEYLKGDYYNKNYYYGM